LPHSQTEPIIVNRLLPDGEIETIGRIYQDASEDGTVSYTCINQEGEQMFLPTTEWTSVENAFEKYGRELWNKSIVRDIRQRKGRNNKAIGISK
jgi:hypothetical protein